jgi:hypothetical protein
MRRVPSGGKRDSIRDIPAHVIGNQIGPGRYHGENPCLLVIFRRDKQMMACRHPDHPVSGSER